MTAAYPYLLALAVLVAISCIAYFLLRAKSGRAEGENSLQVIQRLQASNALWPQIMADLNPKNDREVAQLLIELRGPHMFAPHVALNILENASRSMENKRSSNIREVLRAACESMKKVTQFGV